MWGETALSITICFEDSRTKIENYLEEDEQKSSCAIVQVSFSWLVSQIKMLSAKYWNWKYKLIFFYLCKTTTTTTTTIRIFSIFFYRIFSLNYRGGRPLTRILEMTKEKTKIRVEWIGIWWSSVFWSQRWELDPVLAPGVDVGVLGGLVGEAVLLLGEGGLGEEREQPVEVDHF